MSGGVLLERLLRPLERFLSAPDVRDLCCNEPGVVWVERSGALGMVRHEVPELTEEHLLRLAHQVAVSSDQQVSGERPLLGGRLPGGERIQCVLPPVCAGGAFAIRRQVVRTLSLGDYVRSGAFAGAQTSQSGVRRAQDCALLEDLEAGHFERFFRRAVQLRRNLLISGAPGAGKTTFLGALAREIPEGERIVTIEDAREIELRQPNWLALTASKGEQGEARVDVADLLEAALRLRPDRILLGELRGAEAYTYLRAINFGRRGSLATLHAESPERAIEQLGLMVLQARMGLDLSAIRAYVRPLIDGIVQITQGAGGAHRIEEIHLAGATDPRSLSDRADPPLEAQVGARAAATH